MEHPVDDHSRAREGSALAEERARALLEGIDAVVWEMDVTSGRATYVSPRAETLLGYPTALWSEPGFWAERLVHPEDREMAVRVRDAALAEGRDHEVSYRARTAEGRTVWLRDLARVAPRSEASGTLLRVVTVDITARKEAEAAAKGVERRHAVLLEAAAEGIYGLDAEGNTTFVNPAATRILQWEAEELIGRPQHEMIHHTRADGTPLPREECPIYATMRDRQVHRVEEDVFWRRDGGAVAVAYTSTPIIDEGRVLGAVVTFRDVSQERLRERRLRESEEQLLEAQRIAHLGSWEWDAVRNSVSWSDEMYRVYGLEPGDELRDWDAYLQMVVPEDRARVDRLINDAIRDNAPFDLENRIVTPAGESRMLRMRGRAVIGADGRLLRLVGTCQDVTEEKERAAREMELAREHEARIRAEAERQRAAFLAEAGAALSASLDYEVTLGSLARLAVPRLADWCVIDLVEGGEIRRLVTVHPDPAKEELARELGRRYAPRLGSDSPVSTVLRTGEPQVVAEIPDDLIPSITQDEEHARIVRALSLRSFMVVPLLGAEGTLGAITFIAAESGRTYSADDLPFARELAARAGLAMENARLYRTAEESRAQVSRILESITDAFFALDGEWRFTYLNQEAERLLQTPRDAVLGKSIWEEFPHAVGSEFERRYRGAVETGKTVLFEAFYPPPLHAWYEVRAYPAEEGGLSVYFRNIDEQKTARDALHRSEERFRSLVQASAAIVWTTEASGEFVPPQPEWSEFTGQGADELRGTGWIEAIHPADRAGTVAAWEAALRTKTVYQAEHRLRRRDGEYRHMQARAVPVLEESGEVREWVGIHADVTAQRQAEEERERAVATRARFYATMSHELRTPINAVLGYTDLILVGAYGELNEKQTTGIERTRRAARHLLELVNDVLDLSKLEAGKLEMELEAVEMPELIEDLFATVRPLAAERGSELQLTSRDGTPAIQTDPRRVRQILLNLLSNAIKFGGGKPVEVVCSPSAEGGAVVEVVDHGDGIAPENLPRIFEEFVQVGEEKGGTGLGLPISKRLADLLGGRLEVESTVGVGSTFRLVLPRRARVADE